MMAGSFFFTDDEGTEIELQSTPFVFNPTLSIQIVPKDGQPTPVIGPETRSGLDRNLSVYVDRFRFEAPEE